MKNNFTKKQGQCTQQYLSKHPPFPFKLRSYHLLTITPFFRILFEYFINGFSIKA